MIWRDDDVLRGATDLDDLLAVDDLLQQYGRVHTLAVIADTLTPKLATIIRDRKMNAQLHCWHHDDLSVDVAAVAQLPMAVQKMEELIGVRPRLLFPPWNRVSPLLRGAAADLGLAVSHEKISLEQVIRRRGHVDPNAIVNFHFWHAPDREALAQALAVSASVPTSLTR